MRRAPVSGGDDRIAPQQHPLRAGPHPKEHIITAPLLKQISISVAQESPGTVAQTEDRIVFMAGLRHFQFADGGLMVTEAHMLGPVLGRYLDRHASGYRHVHHFVVDALSMHVDFDPTACALDAFKYDAPEIVAALGYPAFTVHPEGDPLNRRAGFQQQSQSVTAIRAMTLGREPLNVVIRPRAVGPLVGMRPQAKLEIEPAPGGLFPDEAQHFEIAIPFGIFKRDPRTL